MSRMYDGSVSSLILLGPRFKLLFIHFQQELLENSSSFNGMLVVLYPEVRRQAPKKPLSIK